MTEQRRVNIFEFERTPEQGLVERGNGHLPVITVSDRQLRNITADGCRAIIIKNKPPRIFRRGGELVRIEVVEKEDNKPTIRALNEHAMRGELARAADWFTKSGDDLRATAPPMNVVRDLLTMPGGYPEIPALRGIVEAPVMRPDGTILNQPGYDIETRLYYHAPADVEVPAISEKPTPSEISAARDLLLDVFCDFPLDSPASRANLTALLLTPLVRPIINGPTPLAVITKPQIGSGATLMATTLAIITTGRPGAMMNAPKDTDEWRKTIVSLLLDGRGVNILDNVEGALYDSNLASVLTTQVYSARLLGLNKVIDLPNEATWIANGNNVTLGGDLQRRCYMIRIEVDVARPWRRDPATFKHDELPNWAMHERGKIVAAGLTIARAWIAAGRPRPANLPRLGGYESWVRVVGGVLAYAGITGFLANLDEMYENNDEEMPAWATFLSAWYERFGDGITTCADIRERMNADADFAGALPNAVDPPRRDKNTNGMGDIGFTRRLGKALGVRRNRIYSTAIGDLKLCEAGKSHSANKWQVLKKGEFHDGKLPPIETKGEFGEFSEASSRVRATSGDDIDGQANSPNSPTEATPSVEQPTPNSPDSESSAGVSIADAVDLWRADGMPLVKVPGGAISDLGKALQIGMPNSYMPAVREYVAEAKRRVNRRHD